MFTQTKSGGPMKIKLSAAIVLGLLLLVSGCTDPLLNPSLLSQRANTPGHAAVRSILPGNFKVIGYMPSWSGDVNQIQYDKLTHINYAFLLPTSSGGLTGNDNPSKL